MNTRTLAIVCLILVAIVAALLVAFYERRDPAVANQIELVRLLVIAEPQFGSADHSFINAVRLDDRMVLTTASEQTIVGYRVRLRVRGSRFTIEAFPIEIGKTGLFAFFRDEFGIIRFEQELGRPATSTSREWNRHVQ